MHRAAECFRWLLFQYSFRAISRYTISTMVSRLIYRTSKQNSQST